ncbi:MAG: hypothetical protein AB7G11_00970 [Phycisphaerales bacterium]
MSSTYKSQGIFNSGPHRFSVGAEGEYLLVNARVDPYSAGSTPVGPLEVTVMVTGRLQAASEGALWTLRSTITALLTHPLQVGALVDHNGHSWSDMSFTRIEWADRTDRGRVWSIGYTATFTRLLT